MVRLTPFRAEWPHLRPLDLRVRIACAGRELPGGPLLVGICLVDLSCFPLPGAPRYGFNLFKSGRAKSVLVMRLCHQQSHIPENSIKSLELGQTFAYPHCLPNRDSRSVVLVTVGSDFRGGLCVSTCEG